MIPDQYAVFGNPIAHSRSPAIHSRFAALTGENLSYAPLLAPLDGFAQALLSFIAAGGRGANVTVPFKEEAARLCTRLTPRAARAGAVNTLLVEGPLASPTLTGDNTDGAGLVADLTGHLATPLAGRRVLLLGAGGAARGVIAPLCDAGVAALHIANRSGDKAAALAAAAGQAVSGGGFETLGDAYDVVINATSASLSGAAITLPGGTFAPGSLAYDMMYGKGETPFLAAARQQGASRCSDGLGMLVEQAAEAFFVWRGIRPPTASVLAELAASLAA